MFLRPYEDTLKRFMGSGIKELFILMQKLKNLSMNDLQKFIKMRIMKNICGDYEFFCTRINIFD